MQITFCKKKVPNMIITIASPVWESSSLLPAVESLPDILWDLLGIVRCESTEPTLVQEVRAEVH